MPTLDNPTIKNEDLLKIVEARFQSLKDNIPNKLGIIDTTNSEDILTEVKKGVEQLKAKLFLAKDVILIQRVKLLNSAEILSSKLSISAEYIDVQIARQISGINKKIKKLLATIKAGDITKTGIENYIVKLNEVLEKVTFKSVEMPEIDDNFKPLEDIKYLKVEVKEPAAIFNAPLLLTMPTLINKSVLSRLEKYFKLKHILGTYYLAKNADFLVIDVSKLPKTITPQEQSNKVVTLLSRKVATMVVPVHEISKQSGKWYAVLLVSDNITREITDITNMLLKSMPSKGKNTFASDKYGNAKSKYTIYLE